LRKEYHVYAILLFQQEINRRRRHGERVRDLMDAIEVEAECYARDHINGTNKGTEEPQENMLGS
jgi:hypothetical protein